MAQMVNPVVKEKIVILRVGKPVNQKGYSLVVVMVAVIIMGILAEAAISLDSYRIKKSKEAELLYRGLAYQNAILSYSNASVSSQRNYPKHLKDILFYPRFSHRLHIRYLYSDPMLLKTKNINREIEEQWRILRNEKGGIVGVASKNKGKPLKKAFFPPSLIHFTQAKQYSDWVFDVN
jgi:type II secretory pathway pseudopilin PulG